MRLLSLMCLAIFILILSIPTFAGNCGDVNNDTSINIFDITHLISYLYMEGLEPDCGLDNIIGTVTDIDGNLYYTVKIGDQWWMLENLKVTQYRNGDPIPNVTDNGQWGSLSTGAYCNYNNDESKVAIYGRLYNWFAVNDSRNIAPEGWHVPSDAEWQTLIDYLGGNSHSGGKMKDTGLDYWLSPNEGATNEGNFTALPSGYRYPDGSQYYGLKYQAHFWSTTESITGNAWTRYLLYNNIASYRYTSWKENGFSVRCVKD